MIIFENTEVVGWEAAIRGMRNPMNSWEKSDTQFYDYGEHWTLSDSQGYTATGVYIGLNDHDLMMRLAKAGSEHAKYRRMIVAYVDITAPLYWWKEFDTYKVGTVANSCSTMHKIAEKEFTLKDFSTDHLESLYVVSGDNACDGYAFIGNLCSTIRVLNLARSMYLKTKDKCYWWQMIQLLPSSYNQRRTVMMNYEVLANIYRQRQSHKLDEWQVGFMEWIESLPYSEIITGKEKK